VLRRPLSSKPGSDQRERGLNDPESEFHRDLPLDEAGAFPLSSSPAGPPIASVMPRPRAPLASPSNGGSGLPPTRHFAAPTRAVTPAPDAIWAPGSPSGGTWSPSRDEATRTECPPAPDQTGTTMVIPITDGPDRDRRGDATRTEAPIEATTLTRRLDRPAPAADLRHHHRVRRSASRLIGGICTLLMFAVPVAAFAYEAFSRQVPRAAAPSSWRPTPPPIILAGRWNVGWALNGHKASKLQMENLEVTDAVTIIPTPKPIPAVLTSMPTTGWTLDNGATITTDSHGVLVLRPLTNGRPSLPGQGRGWRGAYWLPLNTANWQNYALRVTVTNLGAEGSGGSATVVVGHTDQHVGYAVSISAARITIQNQSGAHLFSGVIPAATSHRVDVTLTKQLRVTVDGSLIAAFHTGDAQGGIGFGVYKPTSSSNLPFFTNLRVGPK
jgi:hypothetical protein